MPPNGKKKHLPRPDVLNNLPESVIDDILTRLTLRDVVRTSILSKKWRYRWHRLPQMCGDPYVDFHYEAVPQDVVDEIPASFSDMTVNHLRTVKFYNVTGADAEMQLIKVLLAKSPALVIMVIQPCEMKDKESFKVLAEITKFQRASSKAEVVYPYNNPA